MEVTNVPAADVAQAVCVEIDNCAAPFYGGCMRAEASMHGMSATCTKTGPATSTYTCPSGMTTNNGGQTCFYANPCTQTGPSHPAVLSSSPQQFPPSTSARAGLPNTVCTDTEM